MVLKPGTYENPMKVLNKQGIISKKCLKGMDDLDKIIAFSLEITINGLEVLGINFENTWLRRI